MPVNEIFGIIAISIMVISYALENKSTVFIASFAFGCALAAYYAYMIESYPFMVAESIWSIIALWRWMSTRNKPAIPDDSDQG